MNNNIIFYMRSLNEDITFYRDMTSLDGASFFTDTSSSWILQTYLKLKKIGVDVQLSTTLPDRGLVVAFEGDLPVAYPVNKDRYLISVIADGSPRSFANLRIVQNRAQLQVVNRSSFIPHWPQPGLLHRDITRGTKVTNAVYIGDRANIAPELLAPEFSRRLAELGVNWSTRLAGDPRVNDFSDVDILVAVRSFKLDGYLRKPASKLQNAWLAGVPAILGPEVAFQEIGTNRVDYFEARSQHEIETYIKCLNYDSQLYASVVAFGHKKIMNIEQDIMDEWLRTLESACIGFEIWKRRNNLRSFHIVNIVDQKIRGIRHRLLRACGQEHNAI